MKYRVTIGPGQDSIDLIRQALLSTLLQHAAVLGCIVDMAYNSPTFQFVLKGKEEVIDIPADRLNDMHLYLQEKYPGKITSASPIYEPQFSPGHGATG